MINEEVVKAIWAAGYRTGHQCGSSEVSAFEHGYRSHEPQTPEKAWEEYVAPYLAARDHEDLKAWEDIP